MEQMPKIPYLVTDRKGRKLRRNVPPDLRAVVGKTAWVRRVSGKTWGQIKQEANAFGFTTGLEITRLREIAKTGSRVGNGIEPGFTIPLDDSSVIALALSYFRKRDAGVIEAGGYVLPDNTSFLDDIIVDAELDLADADLALSGQGKHPDEKRWMSLKRHAFKFLVEEGWAAWPNGPERRVPEAIHDDKYFFTLCHHIARADREIARRRVEAITSGKHPSLENRWFSSALEPAAQSSTLAQSLVPRTVAELTGLFLNEKAGEVGLSRRSQFNVPIRALHEQLGERTDSDQFHHSGAMPIPG